MAEFIIIVIVVGIGIFGIHSCTNSDAYKAQLVREAKQDQLDAKPRLVSEADGCKVYAFKGGDRWRYFTRCANQTTTENDYEVRSGKTHRTVEESITTETGKP